MCFASVFMLSLYKKEKHCKIERNKKVNVKMMNGKKNYSFVLFILEFVRNYIMPNNAKYPF